MKRFFVLAALVLGLAACQTEPEGLDVNVGGEVDTTITVSLPETTRATDSADGAFENVDLTGDATIRYILKIYQKVGNEYKASNDRQVEYSDGKSVVFPVRLVPNRDYRFVVWADYVKGEADVDYHYNTADLTNITLNNTWEAMDETRDAFTGVYCTVEAGKQYTGTSSINITLTRPFAKLRVITTDMEQLNDLAITPTKATVEYTVDHYNAFNAFAGEAIGDSKNRNIKHENFDIKAYGDNDDESMVLFTDYFFANNDVVKFDLTVVDQNGAVIDDTIAFNTDINVKRNHLTTITGDILTDGNNVTVKVEDGFAGTENWPNESTEQLAYAAMFGGVVTLSEDVVLTQPLEIVDGANVVINLEGKTLTGAIKLAEGAELTVNNGTIVNTNNKISGITSNGDLTLNNVTIKSARHGVRVESGNVVINGGEYKVDPISNSTLHALNVGDDGTTANVVIKGGTFIGPKGTMADSGSAVNVRNGSSVVIEGGNFSGGKSKTLSGVNITVKGGTFDQNPSALVADGYKAIAADGLYYVLPEKIAVAAETAGVTSVTESTADVATALATNNGEATMFMWNDVAYIAKYGEVVITSIADEATTVRGVVESSTGLKSATVADGIEVVGNRTFRKCANLETVALPNTLTEIGPAVFQSCSKLANIPIPQSVTTIGEGAFAECTALTSINIPYGVTRIEADALRATGLVSVEFHEGVTYFGAQAFRDCKQLKEVIINAPEFTVEANAFGVMSGAPGTTIYVANAKMKAYLESTLAYKNQFTIVAPEAVANAEQLAEALANRENVVLTQDVTAEAATTAPYGNKYAFKLDGGVIDGNGHELHMECYGDDYGIMTSGGTIKNVTINEGCRAVMIMCPHTDVILDNVNIGGDGVLYPINTGEAGAEGVNLVVTNSVLAGWTSYGLIESATFTNVEFKQGTYYNNIYGRVLKPYVNTTLTNCSFVEHMNLDLSDLGAGHKIVMKNCTVNGQAVTAKTFTIPTTDAQYDTELFTIDLPSWASSINDCVVFE